MKKILYRKLLETTPIFFIEIVNSVT